MSRMYKVRNVDEALSVAIVSFDALARALEREGVDELPGGRIISPRGMKTYELNGVVVTEYRNPTERVVLNQARDANPFFHLMESLWILAGRNDVEWLSYFNSRMPEYSDDGKVFHAPYGYRLRYSQAMANARRAIIDQVDTAIQMLKEDPDSRRVVMQIWDAGSDLNADSKDIPCNDMIAVKVRDGKLNLTVFNRSNDAIWGAYGANAVQFSMLQEYMASSIGIPVGIYTQVSDSLHVYADNPQFGRLRGQHAFIDRYEGVSPHPIMNTDKQTWDRDLKVFMQESSKIMAVDDGAYEEPSNYEDIFFSTVAVPMLNTWVARKRKDLVAAWAELRHIQAEDWRLACGEWMERRDAHG